MLLRYRLQLILQLSFIFCAMLALAIAEAHGGGGGSDGGGGGGGLTPAVAVDAAAVDAPAAPPARAAVIASVVPVVAPEALPSILPELAPAVAVAITGVATASSARSGKLAAWLVAGSSVLWALIAVARRKGQLLSRKAVIGTSLVASMIGVAGAQLLLGVSQAEAWVFAITGPSAIWLNALLRAFGWNISPSSKS